MVDSEDDDLDADAELRLEIQEREDYRLYPASSVRGGVQFRGDFLIEFFFETYENPGAEIYDITDEHLGDKIRDEEYRNAIISRKQTGVSMSQQNAYSLAKWVIANLFGEGVSESDVESVLIEEFEDELEKQD